MYKECRDYLATKLTEAGVHRPPHTARKRMEQSAESHFAAVLPQGERLEPQGRVVAYKQDGRTLRRKSSYDRVISYSVIIGDYTLEAAEAVYARFLASLAPGIWAGGDYIQIEPQQAIWEEDEDQTTRARVSVTLQVDCTGPVSRDVPLTDLSDYEPDIQAIKEETNGNG